jgi:uracil permease
MANGHRLFNPFVTDSTVPTGFDVYFGYGIIGTVLFRGFYAVIPILFAVVAGYFLALFMGLVDTAKISEAAWFAYLNFRLQFMI